jgi:hypothetical protein
MTGVKLFCIGHAVELYLKASYTKITNNIDKAIRFNHNIYKLFKACKDMDINFMPNHNIIETIINSDILESKFDSLNLGEELHFEFLKNQELYIICKMLPDLKYLGAPIKSIKGGYSLGWVFPNNYWIYFFREIRKYIGHPEAGKIDVIAQHIESNDIPEISVSYLKGLY